MRGWRATAAALWLVFAWPLARASWFDDSVTEPFLVPQVMAGEALSPDGERLAAIMVDGEQHAGLALFETRTGRADMAIQAKVHWNDSTSGYWRVPWRVNWMNDTLLAVDFNDGTASQSNLDGSVVGTLGKRYLGMFRPSGVQERLAVAIQAGNSRRIVEVAPGSDRTIGLRLGMPDSTGIGDWLEDDSGLIRLVRTWKVDEGTDRTRISTWYRRDEKTEWTRIDERSITDDPFVPVMVGGAGAPVIVQAYNGEDHLAMWNFDPAAKVFGDAAARHPTEDIVGVDSTSGGSTFTQVVTDGLKPLTVWFDSHMAAVQAAIDQAIPGHVNDIEGSGNGMVLIRSYSDVDPGRISLLDTRTMKLREVATLRPGIDPKRMQPMRMLHYPSFDGLSIPAYLTLPGKPAKPAPLIVLIHGGPQARDRWGWQYDVQNFAAHGYAVFQPQFRGSTGFGRRFEEAGYGQWGQAMQDDITAGVRWLVEQKIADPARICIIGASYGGYAALWGLEKTPELYKCGVSSAGVSDLEMELREESDVSQSALQREYGRTRIGDPALMKDTFDSVSPLQHADRVVAPVLIFHGTKDERVPIAHGRRMFEALRHMHKDVQFVEFDNEKHTLMWIANQRKWFDKVFSLLERTIGKGDPSATAKAP